MEAVNGKHDDMLVHSVERIVSHNLGRGDWRLPSSDIDGQVGIALCVNERSKSECED